MYPLTQHYFIAMASGRQKDYTQKAIKGREVQLSVGLCSLAKRRQQNPSSIASSSRCPSFFASKIAEHQAEMNKALSRSHGIGLSKFTFNFISFSDSDSVLYFRFSKANVYLGLTGRAIQIAPAMLSPPLLKRASFDVDSRHR